jgi:hypothetical protein
VDGSFPRHACARESSSTGQKRKESDGDDYPSRCRLLNTIIPKVTLDVSVVEILTIATESGW